VKNSVVQALQCTDNQVLTTEELQQLRTDTATRIDEHRAEAKKRYDAKHAKPTVYSEGDLVLAENEQALHVNSSLVIKARLSSQRNYHMIDIWSKICRMPNELSDTINSCMRPINSSRGARYH